MFKLQRLEITGFKSFADYTEIVFTGNGITAVVGPNGCGKSNVSDCISWVLGEQRAKSLRGGEMKDVIFQGSRNRKPGGMAEVILHMVRDEDASDPDDEELFDIDEALSQIDEKAVDVAELEEQEADAVAAEVPTEQVRLEGETNGYHVAETGEEITVGLAKAAQVGSVQTVERHVKTKRHWRPRSIALDFSPGESVSVTRRLYLSGESEYQLNGRTCRLRDIQDLFAGTGLSGAHYAIVEQGRIGQILSAKPSDRRTLIEEAAGISKFRTRQRAAESRLESAKSNLSRISDIVSEIDKQANSLRRQAGKTRRFIALQEEFRVRLRELFAAEGRYYSELIERLKQELETAVAAERELAEKVSRHETAFREATDGARRAEEALAAVRREHANNALERDRADREHRYQSEQIVELNNRLEALRIENIAVEERVRLIDSEIERLKVDEQTETAAAEASRSELEEAEGQWAAQVEAVRAVEERLEAARANLTRHTAAIERFDELRQQLALNAERLAERRRGLENERERAEQSITDHQNEAVRLERELAAEKEKLAGLDAEKVQVIAAAAEAREKLRGSEEALRSLNEEHSRNKHRHETLHELEEKRAVYFPQVQKLFAEHEKVGVRPIGVLADFLSVDEEAETAVELLFGPYLQTVLVGSSADAARVAAWVRDNNIGRVSTLVVGRDEVSGPAAVERDGSIAGRIGAPATLLDALRSVFPREMSAVLVDDLGNHAGQDGQIAIDRKGEMSVGGRLFVGGTVGTGEKNASLLAFKRELAGLGRAVESLGRKIAAAAGEVERDRRALVSQEEKTVDLQSLIIKVERGLVALEMQEKTNLQEIERSTRHRNVVLAELEQLTGEAGQLENRLAEAAAGERQAAELRTAAADEAEGIGRELNAARTEADAAATVLNEKRTLAATSSERRRSVQYALRRLENERSDLENRLSMQNLEATESTEKIRRIRESVSAIAGKMAASDEEIAREQAELDQAVGSLDAARVAADAASTELAELNRRAAEAINARSLIEVQQTEALTELRNLNEKCVHELNQPLAAVVDEQQVPEDLDLVAARELAEEQRLRLEGFGAINMLAVEELAEAEERLEFLTAQRQDIIDSIGSAEEALREIKVRSRARFKDAFEAINQNFTQFFVELFGGGRGEMTLLEADDILEAGIEIVAQPPGKRLQNILLLSGGEKAMTAIALVLAIFKYRPSPFCLLDEVDAPLDDANVGRFVNKIEEMSEKTQFIVITHNKRTMEAARALYGVTMQEPGVSKIVSVKFE